ncbi:MAG: hypothetical protein M3R38_12855 [Actinomycetota bacterium]|nr:hypothetical protein [Actinomycetota bacterium]
MASYDFAPAGEEVVAPEPGDLLLVENDYWTSRIIKFGQKLRYPPEAARYSHVAVFYDERGHIIEALGQGVEKRHVSVYSCVPYYVVRVGAGSGDRRQVIAFLDSVLGARWKYGYLTIASVALTLLTGMSLTFGKAQTAICSGLAASCLVRCGEIFDVPPEQMTPAALAKHFDVSIGEG